MEKEIKFRGKRKDNGEWVYGYLVNGSYGLMIVKELYHVDSAEWNIIDDHEVISETVGQYTGKKDENGKDIYEGDILKCISKNPFSLGEILFKKVIKGECCWHIEDTFMNLCEFLNYGTVTVADSVHDNPELLKIK